MNNNTIQILITAKDAASSVLSSITDNLSAAGGTMMRWGAALTIATAGVAAALGTSAQAAVAYNESIVNTASALGLTTEKQQELSASLLEFGQGTRAGPQAVADAYYEIASGVADASTHMAILNASNKLAEAGNVDLKSTTSALISVMNSYSLKADDAGSITDILTNVVRKGVGTMADFASALPAVTSLSSSLGISFTDVGSAAAFLTTKGQTAAQAATQLRAMMVSLLNPNASMKKGLAELGYENGQAAIQALGLVGAMKALQNSQEAGTVGFAAMAGSVEALNGAIILGQDGFESFNQTFQETTAGAADAAAAIQNASPAAQLDLLRSTVSALQISIGNALLPVLNSLIAKVKPIIEQIITWVQANPELTGTILAVVSALVALGPILVAAGGAIAFLASPIGLVMAALGGLAFLLKDTLGPMISMFIGAVKSGTKPLEAVGDVIIATFGSTAFTQGIATALDNIQGGFDTLFGVIGNFGNILEQGGVSLAITSVVNAFAQMLGLVPSDGMLPGLQGFIEGIVNGVGSVVDFITGTVLPVLGQLANWFLTEALPVVVTFITDTVVPAIQGFFTWLGDAWTTIQPGLQQLADWFLNTALPAVVTFVQDVVLPAIQSFFTWLGNAWATIQPGLQQLADWFLTTAIPAVVTFVTDVVVPAVQGFIDILVSIWTTVEPVLSQLANWFIVDVMPQVVSFIQDTVVPTVQDIIDILVGLWDTVSPTLEVFANWFTQDVLPGVVSFINDTVIVGIQNLINLLTGIWELVRPGLEALRDGIQPILEAIVAFFQPVVDFVNTLITRITDLKGVAGVYQGAAQNASTAVGMVTSGQVSPGQFISALARAVGAEFGGPHALGVDFVPRPQFAMLHRGERVMTATENANYGSGGATFNFSEGSIVVNGNTQEEGAAAASGFFNRLKEIALSRDVVIAGGG